MLPRSFLITILLVSAIEVSPAQNQKPRSVLDLVREAGSNLRPLRENTATYGSDQRASVIDLYEAQLDLAQEPGWILEEVFREEIVLADGEHVALPCNCLRTRRKGTALWILTGIHGEEPAGPNALAESLPVLMELEGGGIPVVVFPLLNPLGYQRNWRYPNAATYSKSAPGTSVGDSDHLLPDEKGNPRSRTPACRQAGLFTAKVLEVAREYPPLLTLDLHEDNMLQKGYVYSQGTRGADDPPAKRVVELFRLHAFPILVDGMTRFDEPVKGGIVSNVKDGSVDELLSAPTVIIDGRPAKGPAAPSVLVLETSSMSTGLEERKQVHSTVLASLKTLWKAAQR